MKQLLPPDSYCLLAAEGWLELGLHLEANAELDEISAGNRSHPDVLQIRWHIYAKEKRWEACVEIGRAIMHAAPERSFGWIQHAFALHELKRTELAYTHLVAVADKFPDNWRIPYNLACYCAQLGRLEEASGWFQKATAINVEIVVKQGIDDPDLKPIWDSLSGRLA